MAVAASTPQNMDPYFVSKVKGPPMKENEEMQYEGIRLATFKDWPQWVAVWPTPLARAGFFYTKTADEVACFSCGGRLKTWEAGDSPMTEHKRFFPQCRFVTGRDNRNVPLGESTLESPPATSGGQARPRQNIHSPSNYHSSLASYAGATATTNDRPSSSFSVNALVQQHVSPRGQHESLLGQSTPDGSPGQQPSTHTRNGPLPQAPEVPSDGRGIRADDNSRLHRTEPSTQSLQVQVQVRFGQASNDPTAAIATNASRALRPVLRQDAQLATSLSRQQSTPRNTVHTRDRQSVQDTMATFCEPGSDLPQQWLQQVWPLLPQRNAGPTHLDEVSAVVYAADGLPVTHLVARAVIRRRCDVCDGLDVCGSWFPCCHIYCQTCLGYHESSRCCVCHAPIGMFVYG